jgi:SAM-dependent methyltransferase
MTDLISRFYPENEAGGFSRSDGTVQFYQRVHALLGLGHRILDFGAGRGAAYYEDPSSYRKRLRDLRGEGRCIIGVDVDPIVTGNPWLDEAIVLEKESTFPFPDEHFDLIVSDSTFEHIADPARTVSELGRVLKAGGWICARTPNRYGYVALINRILPSRMSKRLVTSAQPGRQEKDIFPAYYRMNTLGRMQELFPIHSYEHRSFAFDSEPRYHFNRQSMFLLLLGLHAVTPPALRNTLMLFIRKHMRYADAIAA